MAANNYFKTIRKSYIVPTVISVLTNLMVFGQPVQQMVLAHYGTKTHAKVSGDNHHHKSEKYNNIKEEKPEGQLASEKTAAPGEKLSGNSESSGVFYANEQQAVIGKLSAIEGENPYDNFFSINLPENIDLTRYEAVLAYDLYGLSHASHTTKSINSNLAYGGKVSTVTNGWASVKENISVGHLKPGANDIFFNRRVKENYQYKIRNLRVELIEKGNEGIALAEKTLANFKGSVYLLGVALDKDVTSVEVLNQVIPVCNGVFEYILNDVPENTGELEIFYKTATGHRQSFLIPVNYRESNASFEFTASVFESTAKAYALDNLTSGSLTYNALSLAVSKAAPQYKNGSILVEGLTFKDVKTLENEVVNVTAGEFYGYRIHSHNLPDSTSLELRLKYDPEKIPQGYTARDIKTFFFDKSQRNWKVLPVDSLNYAKNEIISTLYDNETDYINGVIKVPESPETGSFAPTAISDMKYADPTASVVSIPPPSPNSTGSASTSFPIKLPQGRNGMQPSLAVTYNSDAGNGWMGIGWNLATEAISINTKWGVPTFNGTYESEIYSLNGADLVLKNGTGEYTSPHRQANISRGATTFYMRKEGGYQKIIRHGISPSNYWWEVTDKMGNKSFYGGVTGVDNGAVIKTAEGKIAYWALKRTQDPYGNYIDYYYTQSSSPIPGTTIPAKEFYLDNIIYTRHTSQPTLSATSYYQISFKRNTYAMPPAGSATRGDMIINARNGYTQVIDELLTEIHVSFKQAGQSIKRIRSYRFDYTEGPFKKQQLTKISEFDTANKLFYSNTMEYYDQIGSGNIIAADPSSFTTSGNDEITSNLQGLPGVDLGIIPNGSPLGTSTSSGFSTGLRTGAGIGFIPTSVKNTVGFSVNYSQNNQKAKINFIDINGDGLPDKVLEDGSGLRYRPNTGSGFGNMMAIGGIVNLSETKSRTTGAGVDANIMNFGFGKSWSKTKSVTSDYFSDFNGDGLPDIIYNGRVRFNTSPDEENYWDRSFSIYPDLSENPIESGGVSSEIIPFLQLETMEELREQHPQFDHVKVWQAPYSGQVMIESTAKLIDKNLDGTNANEFRMTIERGNFNPQSPDFAVPIASSVLTNEGSSVQINKSNVNVAKGDLLFFRVHNTNNGFGGVIEWNPRITYTNSSPLPYANLVDENGKYLHVYDEKLDFLLNNDGGISPQNGDAYVTLTFNLSDSEFGSYQFSDDITFAIRKTRITLADGTETTSPNWVWTRTYDQQTGNFIGSNQISGIPVSDPELYRDIFYFYAESTSNVDWGAIGWEPRFIGSTSGTHYPGVNYKTYDDNVNQVKYWMDGSDLMDPIINSSAENDDPLLVVRHNMENTDYSEFLNQFGNEDFPLEINWVVKEEAYSGVIAAHSRTFYIYRTSQSGSGEWNYKYTKSEDPNDLLLWQYDPDYFAYALTKERVKQIKEASGKIYSAFYINDARIGINNTATVYFEEAPEEADNYSFPQIAIGAPFMASTAAFYGYPYRGWGQFLYNGALEFQRDEEGNIVPGSNPTFFDGPINISLLDFGAQAQAGDIDNVDSDNPEASLTGTDAGAIRFTFYDQKNEESKYINESIIDALYGLDSNGRLTATVGRFAQANIHDIFVDPGTITGSGIFVGMKQRSESKGSAISGSVPIGGNGTISKASSQVLNQYIDLNGDRYPDIVSGVIQYTDMRGGLSATVETSDFRTGDESEDITTGVSIPALKPNSTEGSKPAGNKTNTHINAGINVSEGKSFNSRQWADMNGDGLPDKVEMTTDGSSSKVEVWLNTGYGFSSSSIIWGDSNIWGSLELLTSSRINGSIGPTFSFNSSFALGFGAATSTANMDAALFDVNGDALPDLVFRQSFVYRYYLNTGKGFTGPSKPFYGASEIEKDVSVSGNVFGSFTNGFVIIVPILPPIKIVFSPSAGVNAGFNEKRVTVQDLNGDGLNDVITKGSTSNNSSLSARLNKTGETNLLKTVNTPLGGSWTIGYDRSENSYKMPNSKWLLASIETNDGFTADNDFKPDETLATVEYENPNYDRREREFLGFGEVTLQQKNPDGGALYRYVTTSYHNENYYLSGAQKGTAVYDVLGHKLSETETLYNLLDPDDPEVNFNASEDNYFMQGGLFSNAEELLDRSRLFIAVARVTTTSYEHVDALSAVTEFLEYDNHGNILSYIDYGEGGDDTYRSDIEYFTSLTGLDNSVGFPKRIRVYQNVTNLMRERSSTYNNKGKLAQVTTRLDANDATQVNRVSFAYDATYGNLTTVNQLDNKNEQQTLHYVQDIEYDNVVHTYPVSLGNSFGESSSTTYDYLFGVPVFTTDMNDASMRTRIDNRGRVVEVTGPNELATESGTSKWTIRMEYKGEDPITGNLSPTLYMIPAKGNFPAVASGAQTPTTAQDYAITRHFDPLIADNPNNQFITISITDGLGQPIQVKKTHQTGTTMKWLVSGFEEKDAYGHTLKAYLPATQAISGALNFYSLASYCTYLNIGPSSLQEPVQMAYDERDRTVSIQQPGETQTAQIEYAIEGDRFVQKVTNELSQTLNSYTDIRGRKRKTVQNDEITTLFDYNAINELVKVTNNEGAMTNYLYDLAGRKTEAQHPDRGVQTFKYDKAGNMIERSNSNLLLAGGQKIIYRYNFGRLMGIDYPQTLHNEVKYEYGQPNDALAESLNAVGRLLYQEDASGVQLFGYGLMGEVTTNLRSVAVAGYQSFWFYTKWKYDSWNRVQEITYPDQEKVTYHYNKAGMLNSITSTLGAQPIVQSIDYNNFGERSVIVYGNNTKTTYAYDTRRRMNILGHTFANLAITNKYDYDVLSNITGITTQDPSNSLPGQGHIGGPVQHSYSYDDYNRLSFATGKYTGSNDMGMPYLQQEYELRMTYNTDHTIENKIQLHRRGVVSSYGAPLNDESVVQKNSYTLDYAEYATAAYVAGPNSYGYQQPHAVRRITEYPSWVSNPEPDDPRIRHKEIEYDANGNQTEIKEKVGGLYTSLRENLWDEENRLRGVDLNPDDEDDHPIAVYTYDAGGARIVRYNLDRIDVSSNAKEVGQAKKDNVMIYPSGLLMGKATEFSPIENRLTYTKHYYIGSERISAKTGTVEDMGLFPASLVSGELPALTDHEFVRGPSDQSRLDAKAVVRDVHLAFGQSEPQFSGFREDFKIRFDHTLELNTFYFHKDHLGSSSYITNDVGNVTQHMEYLPFGETLVDEHTNSFNSPFKFNGKEFDEETGNYYYGARYYDPKWSIFISVDPLAEKYPGWSSYAYCFNNPLNFVDPTGMTAEDPPVTGMDTPDGTVHTDPDGSTWKFDRDANTWRGQNGVQDFSNSIALDGITITSKDPYAGTYWDRDNYGKGPNPYSPSTDARYTLAIIGIVALPVAIEAYGAYAVGGYLLEEAAETAVEQVTGVPVILGPDDLLQHGLKKTAKEGLGNPFKGKTFNQIDEMFTTKGFNTKGVDPLNGKGSYFNPNTGTRYYLDKGGMYKKGFEGPHVDVWYNGHQSFEKTKFFLDGSPRMYTPK